MRSTAPGKRSSIEGRWGMVTWPTELGGRGCDLIEWLIFEEEYYRAGAPVRVNQNGIFLLGPTLMEYGSAEQKARFLPRMATGEDIWAQAWSEPNAGSDMAAIRSKATRGGRPLRDQRPENLVDPRGVGRLGVRYVPHRPAVPAPSRPDVHPAAAEHAGHHRAADSAAQRLAGFRRNFLRRRPGAGGERASVAKAWAGTWRCPPPVSSAVCCCVRRRASRKPRKRLVQLYMANREQADRDPAIGDAVMRAWLDAEAYTLGTYMTASQLVQGGKIGPESSHQQDLLVGARPAHARHRHEHSRRCVASCCRKPPAAGDVGHWLEGFLFAQAGPIYAGTNEIQRNIIAERMLGMPRA